jgi:hypothetical protein
MFIAERMGGGGVRLLLSFTCCGTTDILVGELTLLPALLDLSGEHAETSREKQTNKLTHLFNCNVIILFSLLFLSIGFDKFRYSRFQAKTLYQLIKATTASSWFDQSTACVACVTATVSVHYSATFNISLVALLLL